MTKGASVRRAVGVVRVGRVGVREGERFVSPSEQRERIAAACPIGRCPYRGRRQAVSARAIAPSTPDREPSAGGVM